MKLLGPSPERINLEALISDRIQGDYIYMYPPRQAYRPMSQAHLSSLIRASLTATQREPLNLYLHFPFCRQICGFCNLYSVTGTGTDRFADYVDLLSLEMNQWADYVGERAVNTIYFGGGTPSLLSVQDLNGCLRHLEEVFAVTRSGVSEVAIEVAPDTVDRAKLRDLRSIGVNRVNVGLQTTSDRGLHQIGRRHGFAFASQRIHDALSAGFANVCIDLIYGLPGQTVDQWRETVEEVVRFGAQTVCAYPLTLRPNTGFARKTVRVDGADQYHKYELARDLLREAGYEQETHVRYVLPGRGGYQQKRNHWAGQDVLGIGAGARGYLRYCDYRNGYSIKRRRDALESYRERMLSGRAPFVEGFALDEDERMRRQVILGLLAFDTARFRTEFGKDVFNVFPEQMKELLRLELIDSVDGFVYLTTPGRKYRDLLVQLFFSPSVWKYVDSFDYGE